jgi:hypothetical protein
MIKLIRLALLPILASLPLLNPAQAGADLRPLPVNTMAAADRCAQVECVRVAVVLQSLAGQHRVNAHVQCRSGEVVHPCRHVEVAPRLGAGGLVLQGGSVRCGQLVGDQPCPSRVDAVLGWLPDSGGPYQGLATAYVMLGTTTQRIDVATIRVG